MNSTIQTYLDYMQHISHKPNERYLQYRTIVEEYPITSALYPGSHIDITPSLFIPTVTYVDNFKGTISFFKDNTTILNYIQKHKVYSQEASITFLNIDYTKSIDVQPVDLIISQYAGFVGQATKPYLKENGILFCNDSHGDATLAYLDDDYTLIGVLDGNVGSYHIQTTDLHLYFQRPRQKSIDIDYVTQKMKPHPYTKNAIGYIFQKSSNNIQP